MHACRQAFSLLLASRQFFFGVTRVRSEAHRVSTWRLKTLAVTEGKLCVRSPVSEGKSDLTKCANTPLVWKAKTTGLHNGDWMRSVGYRLEVVEGWEGGKATEADFSMSHLAVCKPSAGTRSNRLGLTCSHRNRSKVAGEYFSGVQPKNS